MTRLALLLLLALFLAACLQTPSPTPSATVVAVATSTPTPSLAPSPSSTVTSIPSATAVASPSVSANTSASASVPSLADAALRLEPILNDVFNVSRTAKHQDRVFSEIDSGVWSIGASEAQYTYVLTLSNAHTRWLPEELLETAQNASGAKNGFLSYTVGGYDQANIMKCYRQRYEINLNLKGYDHTWFGLDYQPLMRNIMGRLVDACPA